MDHSRNAVQLDEGRGNRGFGSEDLLGLK
jgi:hypothetical protein